MDDIVERLRAEAKELDHVRGDLLNEAAAEIRRLRSAAPSDRDVRTSGERARITDNDVLRAFKAEIRNSVLEEIATLVADDCYDADEARRLPKMIRALKIGTGEKP